MCGRCRHCLAGRRELCAKSIGLGVGRDGAFAEYVVLPMGSVLVTADEIPDPQALRLRSWRLPGSGPDDGAEILMQDGTTADMIWGVAELIEFISNSITLEPGDVIATGTPSGVGVFRDPPVFLLPGDRVRCEIEGIGTVENPVIDWSDVDEEPDLDDDVVDAD